MAALPDEMWWKILEMGIENTKLSYKDLCCISIVCRRFNRLSKEDTLWSTLLALDFPLSPPSQSPPFKALYKSRFEKDKERRLAARRRAVLRIESQVALHINSLKQLRVKLVEEKERMKAKIEELSNLDKQRRASVAMKVWQPEIVRHSQKRMVEQCVMPVEFRISAVEMELKLCRQQITVLDKTHSVEKHRLDAAKEQLALLKYHPLQDLHSAGTSLNVSNIQLKKLKRHGKSKIG